MQETVESACRPIDEWLLAHRSVLVGIRRHLHMHPESSGEERETSLYLAERLAEVGVESRVLRDGLGVVADASIGTPGPDAVRVALRADIDALEIADGKTVEYRSCHEGLMHGCGHDVHSTVVLGVAMAVAEHGDCEGPGVHLRYLFQPAEEICLGAKWLVEQGVLEGVDAILGLHVDPERPAGEVGVRSGALTAHCNEVIIHVRGQGGHAARPHQSRDPIAATVELAAALYALLPRGVDSRHASVFSIGRIHGGTVTNVIPDEVEILGSLRTVAPGDDKVLKERILEISAGVASMTGTQIDVVFRRSLEAVRNDPDITGTIERAARMVLGDAAVKRIELPSLGGEDFSVYQQQVPGSMFRLGTRTPDGNLLHTPEFDIDEDSLVPGARILIRAALLWGMADRTKEGLPETVIGDDDGGGG
jgi:amidohydrolase